MIRYAMKCEHGHEFDGWFRSADAFDSLSEAGMVACVLCGSSKVEKAVMAPRLQGGRKAGNAPPEASRPAAAPAPGPLSAPASPAELALRELRRRIEANSENVGRDFAREARAIHAGEAEARPIIGEAAPEEAKSLIEDGVPVAPLPWSSRRDS